MRKHRIAKALVAGLALAGLAACTPPVEPGPPPPEEGVVTCQSLECTHPSGR